MGLMMVCCGMLVKKMGMIRISLRKMRALTVNIEKMTLIGEGR
jgi:hypothetical protein